MTKVTLAPLKLSKSKSVKKRIRSASGESKTIRVVNGESATLASDLAHLFGANVMAARRSNSSEAWKEPKVATARKASLKWEAAVKMFDKPAKQKKSKKSAKA